MSPIRINCRELDPNSRKSLTAKVSSFKVDYKIALIRDRERERERVYCTLLFIVNFILECCETINTVSSSFACGHECVADMSRIIDSKTKSNHQDCRNDHVNTQVPIIHVSAYVHLKKYSNK